MCLKQRIRRFAGTSRLRAGRTTTAAAATGCSADTGDHTNANQHDRQRTAAAATVVVVAAAVVAFAALVFSVLGDAGISRTLRRSNRKHRPVVDSTGHSSDRTSRFGSSSHCNNRLTKNGSSQHQSSNRLAHRGNSPSSGRRPRYQPWVTRPLPGCKSYPNGLNNATTGSDCSSNFQVELSADPSTTTISSG